MIEVEGLSKRFGATWAVRDLSFQVRPGVVTGFLGPNGAGKSTTMRMTLGLDRPTGGVALINGHPYGKARTPLGEVGALLDAKDVHGGRTAQAHLGALAHSNGLPPARVGQVLEMTGLAATAGKRIKDFSLGMCQRLGIAAAMLGDPGVLLFDEPVNGLDPEGIVWIRTFMRDLAAQGRTVLVSSHLMAEMALTADHLIVIGRGALLADMSTQAFIEAHSGRQVGIRTSDQEQMARLLSGRGHRPTAVEGYLQVTGLSTEQVGELAFTHQIVVQELFVVQSSLEAAFMQMTSDSVQYRATPNGAAPPDQLQPGASGPEQPVEERSRA